MKLILLTKHNKFLSLPSMMEHMDDVHVETEYFTKVNIYAWVMV